MSCCNKKISKIEYYDSSKFDCIDKFYYRLLDDNDNVTVEFLDVVNNEQVYVFPPKTRSYKGFAMMKLTTADFSQPIVFSTILFDGTRITPRNEFSSFTDKMYHETVTIKFLDTEYDIIEAQSIYIDGGNSYVTTEDAEYFTINSASGRFKGATHIKIIYDNNGTKSFNPEKKKFVRQILILKSL